MTVAVLGNREPRRSAAVRDEILEGLREGTIVAAGPLGEVLTADGPFAETKEQIGGYYVVEAADLDEAVEIAAKIPGARVGTIEVRPIWDM